MLKEARKQSGASWNNDKCMIEADDAIWDNIIVSFSKAQKFRRKYFPLFDTLGELYDGHTTEGTYNFTSTQASQYPSLTPFQSEDELSNTEVIFPNLPDSLAHYGQDDEEDARHEPIENDGANVERSK